MKKIIKLEPDDHVVVESDKIIITKENTATENSDVQSNFVSICVDEGSQGTNETIETEKALNRLSEIIDENTTRIDIKKTVKGAF